MTDIEPNPADLLWPYIDHHKECDLKGHWMQAAEGDCTCGLNKAIAALQQSRSAERAAIVKWLRGDGVKIPALSAFAGLVSGNNMPSMSGDNRARLRPHDRLRFDSIIEDVCIAIERDQHLQEQTNDRT